MGYYRSEIVNLDAEERRKKARQIEFTRRHEKALKAIAGIVPTRERDNDKNFTFQPASHD